MVSKTYSETKKMLARSRQARQLHKAGTRSAATPLCLAHSQSVGTRSIASASLPISDGALSKRPVETEIESWRKIRFENIEFALKRLREIRSQWITPRTAATPIRKLPPAS